MNAMGDDHVSFTASHLALSPCGKYILISTDGARIIMMAVSGEIPCLILILGAYIPWLAGYRRSP